MSCGPMGQASAHRAETCRFESCHDHVREQTLMSDRNMITVYGSHTHAIVCVAVCVVMVLGLVVCGCCVTCVVVMCRGVGGGACGDGPCTHNCGSCGSHACVWSWCGYYAQTQEASYGDCIHDHTLTERMLCQLS